MNQAEAALVEQAQRGDRAAFEELVRRTSRLVYARLLLETGDPHRAEDLLQETLLSAFRSIKELREPGNLRSWLLTIAQNLVYDAARREARQKRAEPAGKKQALESVAGTSAGPDEEMSRVEERNRVLAALRSLPEDYRLPLTLRYLAGADYETIEMQLGLTNGALRGLLHRGLKMLRARLG
jgi:RNA polymerase sigma-70 factor (ECF subfamily)